MSVYQATVDPAERNTSHTMMVELIGTDKEVLDVGCASGYLAEALGKNGCMVSGVEYDRAEAEKARPFLDRLVIADLNQADLAGEFPDTQFDTIVFGDVLEHLLEPARVLQSALGLLRPGGTVVISIPNVAHGSVRLSLLQGVWNYTDTGLLDRTHIKFFTFDSLLALLDGAGLVVTEIRSTVADPLATEVAIRQDDLPRDAVDWVRSQPHAQAYQFVLTAAIAGGDGGDGPTEHATHVLPGMESPPTRDVHTEAAELRAQVEAVTGQLEVARTSVLDLQRRELTSQDHAVAHEAQVARLRAETDRAKGEVARATVQMHDAVKDAQYAHSELAKSIKDSQGAHARLAEALTDLGRAQRELREQHGHRQQLQHELVEVTQEVTLHRERPVRNAVAAVVGPRTWRVMAAPVHAWRRLRNGVRR